LGKNKEMGKRKSEKMRKKRKDKVKISIETVK
jgi:hypothetical protein